MVKLLNGVREQITARASMPALGAAALASLSIAAASPANGPTGKISGLIAGALLITLVGYAFFDYLRPLIKDRESGLLIALLVLVAIAVVKLAVMPFFPGFGPDVGSYQSWAGDIAAQGPAQTYKEGYFLDYPPGYLYALWVAGLVANWVGATGDFYRVIIESPAILADLALALLMFAFVRRSKSAVVAFVAMLMVALNPALLYDTVIWGQSDSVLTFVALLSLVAILRERYEIAWGLAAIAVLVKPQGLMLLPVLGWWTMLKTDVATWIRSGLALIVVAIIGIAPFQIGHEWNWILKLYTSTAAYYHETSVNAFNLMALIGGLRASDDGTIGGITFFGLGMSMLVPLYAYVAWILWRGCTPKRLIFAAFITVFGFFMVAPRMHERYLYPALVLAVPLALEAPQMLAVFVVLSLTCLFNLAYILQTLQTVVFLDGHDGLAMATSAFNVAVLAIAIYFGATGLETTEASEGKGSSFLSTLYDKFTVESPAESYVEEEVHAPPWLAIDTMIISALLIAAAITRFWHLGHPAEIVFDEVHFVAQGRHYLHGESFLDPHPPLAKLVIAAGIWLFGDHPWSWRVGNATLGTALVGITYLLARRMTGSRLTGAIAGGLILLDGLYLVDSRIAVIDIVYLTFAAIAYLVLFRFAQSGDLMERRRLLPWLGLALGLCLASKLYIPAITFLLVTGFLVYILMRRGPGAAPVPPASQTRTIAAVAVVGAVASIAYLIVFLPHYFLGWWGGIYDLFLYFKDVVWYEDSVASATHPYSSKWWSWPLMLRPVAYWQDFPKTGNVSTVWGGGNPLLWWGALTGITITAVKAIERPSLARSFLVIGYLSYFVIWIWIGRTLFLYHYMGSIYLGYIALAVVLTDCFELRAEQWEHLALLLTMTPAFILGLGPTWGIVSYALVLAAYAGMLLKTPYAGRYVAGVFVLGAIVLFVYYFPVWTGMPIERAGYYDRMWLQSSGIRSWI